SHIARHDTLNQIMVIQGYLELMRDSLQDPGILRYLDKLERSAERIRDHIEFTHLYQEVGSQDPQWQRLQDILPDIGERLDVTFETDVDGLEVLADAMLEKVFYNLLDNSMRHGGDIRKVTLHHEVLPEGLMLLWEDDGVGVPDDVKELIFERGFGRNTGMGMFLIREILAITGISIRESGVAGRGARFELLVPPECYRQL
ncbi:MAG: HAMP domain-containing sensor histidine kinase, partial [Candidatus Methanomethylophilaceae archaeon]|nr:HAMP domain-containing sensor histidine kinase [Candidatus Methanomethylophilaceae archaeon]